MSALWRAGLDAGGTKTELLVLDPEDRIVFQAEGPATSLSRLPVAAVLARWEALLLQAEAALGRRPDRLAIGVAGGSDPVLAHQLRCALEKRFPGLEVRIGHDGLIAHLGALDGQSGLLVLCGTGSLVLGRNSEGAWIRAGGWGYLIGDEGGAYRIGLEALRLLSRAMDDPSRHTTLTRELMHRWGIAERAHLIGMLYRSERSPAELAPWVIERAQSGDPVARKLLLGQLRQLKNQVRLVARQLDEASRRVSYSGGLTESACFREHLCQMLAEALPGWVIFPPRNRPAFGAARYGEVLPRP
jgi:glucosamine kinase